MFSLKLAFRPWKLQPLSQILTFTTLGVLMFLAGVFGWLSRSIPNLRTQLDGDRVASVFLDPSAEADNLDSIRDQIRVSLGSSTVKVDYVSSDQFLENLANRQPELAKEVAALGNEKDWIAPKHFSLRGALTEAEIERMKSIPGVEAVLFSEKRFRPIVDNLAAMEWLCRLLSVATIFAMIAVLFLLGRINSSIFSEAEVIVAQMGGTDWQARLPSRMNPLLSSLAASAVAAVLFWRVQPGIAQKMASLSPFLRGMNSASLPAIAILVIGLIVGMLALFFAPKHSRTEAMV